MGPRDPSRADAPQGCLDPEIGRLHGPYLEGELPDDLRDSFERHYFECPACLDAILIHQDLPGALRTVAPDARPAVAGSPRRSASRVWRWSWAAAGALAAGLAAVYFLGPSRAPTPPTPAPFELSLQGTARSKGPAASAPARRPLTLLLAVPVPDDPSVSYDMTMTRDGAGVVFAAGAIRPAGPAEVRVEIPPDAVLPGKYRVLLEERGTPEPMEFRFAFEVSGTEVE